MSDLDLAPIVARETTATPGPWYWEEPSTDSFPQGDQSLRSAGSKMRDRDGKALAWDETVLSGWGYDASGTDAKPHDREFIAHARTDIPALVDEVRKLRAIVERVRAEVDPAHWLGVVADEKQTLKASAIREALVDQCHHIDGEAECWHFGGRDGLDG